MSTWGQGDVIPSGARRRLPSRFALLCALLIGLLVAGIAAAMLATGPPPRHLNPSTRELEVNLTKSSQATRTSGAHGKSSAPSTTAAAGVATSAGVHKAGAAGAVGSHEAGKAGAAGVASGHGAGKASLAATALGGHRLVAEVRDPEEVNSYPAPASVHHSAAKTPQAAGEIQVAAGAASDAEVRSELAKMKAIESAANKPSKMATVPGGNSIVGADGAIAIPSDVPEVIQRVIAGANAIANFPYVYGGGHASFVDNAYDCSGSVSYALAAGGLLSAPETSGQLESWGAPGPGKWITVYANAGHTYMYVNIGGAWMLYDTAGRSGVFASRWQPYPVDNAGYVARHWPDL